VERVAGDQAFFLWEKTEHVASVWARPSQRIFNRAAFFAVKHQLGSEGHVGRVICMLCELDEIASLRKSFWIEALSFRKWSFLSGRLQLFDLGGAWSRFLLHSEMPALLDACTVASEEMISDASGAKSCDSATFVARLFSESVC